MAEVTTTNERELSTGSSDGQTFGQSATDKIAFYGKTPIAQQTAPSAAPAVDPTVSGCAFLASVQSIAIGAASLANSIRQDLIDIGVYV